MKKYILTLLLTSLLLSACSINFNTTNEDFFKKKQECAEYKDEMLEEGININKEWMNRTGDPYDLQIEEIFYNKQYNSCLYVLSIYKWVDVGNGDEKFLLNKFLYDFFSKKEIVTALHADSKEAFDKEIKELKGE